MTQILNKKKKKRISLSLPNIDLPEELNRNYDELRKKIKSIYRYHIGKENSLSSYDLFVKVYNRSPEDFNVFKREYMWNILKKVIRNMRSTNELYVVFSGQKSFVLCSKEELIYTKKTIDRHIESLVRLKKNASIWYKNEMWRNF